MDFIRLEYVKDEHEWSFITFKLNFNSKVVASFHKKHYKMYKLQNSPTISKPNSILFCQSGLS